MIQFAAAKAALGALNWKLVGISAAVMVFLGLMLALSIERRQNDKLERQVEKLTATLKSISDKKDEQRAETDRNIGKARDRIVYVDRKAREVEQAPLPGNCKTPPSILSADL